LQNKVIKKWLTEDYDYERPKRGDIRDGVLIEFDRQGAIVDVGLKRDGIVPRQDIEQLEEEFISNLEPGQAVKTRIMLPEDREGNLLLSLYQAQTEQDWTKAQELLDSGDVWRGKITGYNRGGLLVKFYHLEGFIPASHIWTRLKSSAKSTDSLRAFVGETLPLKVIEVNQSQRRLILSERHARRDLRQNEAKDLLAELTAGQVRQGVVRHITDFGAFVDLGGLDGLIHKTELAWRHINHPQEVVQVGEEVEVYVQKVDEKRGRVNLSLKRLQANPWNWVDVVYQPDQLVTGRVTNVAQFGVFVLLDIGIEGLVHVSELAEPPPHDPRDFVEQGEELVLRILSIDIPRQRLALSLKRVSEAEREAWLAEQEQDNPQRTPVRMEQEEDNDE
jgi:small subunit ribosomal protein S1